MNWPFKTKKSAGVPVTPAVHGLIRSGNRARDARDWPAAAAAYREALATDPALVHIWIQLGHSLKEARDLAGAEAAYREAEALTPHSAEPHLHLGHVAKLRGEIMVAGRHYLDAAKRDASHADSISEIHRLVARTSKVDRDEMIAILRRGLDDDGAMTPPANLPAAVADLRRTLDQVTEQLRGSGRPLDGERLAALATASGALGDLGTEIVESDARARAEGGPAFVFDISDLIGYYGHQRLPTGIQRVQIEAITHALERSGGQTRICCFTNGREDWLEVPAKTFIEITQLSLISGNREDKEWVSALSRLHVMLALALPFEFPQGAYLVNLGTSWWIENYFLFVRDAKAKYGIRYIPFVHDFIPIITPEHCVTGLVQDFISWAIGVFEHADHYLVNSEATKRDLLMVAATLEHQVSADDVDVVRLDADFRKPGARTLAKRELGRWGLESEPYVMLVSTVESRKNHVAAFDAWLELIRRHGVRRVPRLVCVGKSGWLNEPVYFRLNNSEPLKSRVTMLSYLADDELELLYKHCLCTVYPSLYEGWGLPVTESLCYGKVPIVSDSSSLPEAGGAFAEFFESASPVRLADAVERVAYDRDYRREREAAIARDFRPRSWAAIADDIYSFVLRRAGRDDAADRHAAAPVARLGEFYPMRKNEATRIWPGMGLAEIFRTGLDWNWPERWGCWTRPAGGTLEIGVPAGHGRLRVYLWLRGVPGHPSDYRIECGGRLVARGALGADERRWVWFETDAADAQDARPVLSLRLAGDRPQELELVIAGINQMSRVTVALQGFFVCEADDALARSAFLEAVALNTLDDLDAYRDRDANASFAEEFGDAAFGDGASGGAALFVDPRERPAPPRRAPLRAPAMDGR